MSEDSKAQIESPLRGMLNSAPCGSPLEVNQEDILNGDSLASFGEPRDYPITPSQALTNEYNSAVGNFSEIVVGSIHGSLFQNSSPQRTSQAEPNTCQPGLITQRLGLVNSFLPGGMPHQPPSAAAINALYNDLAAGYGSLSNKITSFQPALARSMDESMSASVDSSRSQQQRRKIGTKGIGKRQARLMSEVSEDEGDREKRRVDRNVREQQRSHQITQQISELSELLKQANVPFKPDKFSVLVSLADYIKSLQQKTITLEVERKKVLDTITQASEIVSNQYIACSTEDVVVAAASRKRVVEEGQWKSSSGTPAFLHGIDFQSMFYSFPFACAISTIDGRFVDCNQNFVDLSGHSRSKLMPSEGGGDTDSSDDAVSSMTGSENSEPCSPPSLDKNMSLFNLLDRVDMAKTFSAMSSMLKRPIITGDPVILTEEDTWSDMVQFTCASTQRQMRLSLSLVRSSDGIPRFFNCVAIPAT